MKTPILLLLLCCALSLTAQEPVFFTNQGSLLNPVIGLNYNDCAVDMNGDYLDDIVRRTTSKLYIDYQQTDGTFQQTAFDLNILNEPEWSICAGDLDRNGFNDLLFGGGSAVSFIMANDDGTGYTEKPIPGFIFSQRSTMADIDNDGNLDAFVCHDLGQSKPYRNDGSGNMMLDPNLIETYDRPGNYSSIWTDYDNDGDIDLYITKCKGGAAPGNIDRTNLLYKNNGDGTFAESGTEAGIDDNAQSWSTVFEDFDNDGDFDAFVVNHDFQNRFFRNNGDGTFTDIIDQTGIDPNDLGAWENASGDFNNDGFMDILAELDHGLYLGNGDLTFTGQSAIIDAGGLGDFNNDGFLDIVRGTGLLINQGNDNNWLKINLVGMESNLNGIGARVELYGSWGRQLREVRSGQSFAPMSTLQIHFGIGQTDAIDKLVVKWPSGIITTVDNPTINTTITVQETGCLLPPSDITANGSTVLCQGASVDLTAPDGFTYLWSNGDTTQTITVFEPTVYNAILTDTAGCNSYSSDIAVTVIVETPPTITIEGPESFCEGGSVTLTASEGDNPTWSNGMTGQSIVVSESGDYTVAVDAACLQDQISSEAVTITELEATAPIITGTTINQGQSIELTAQGENLEWYDMATGGNLLATGNTFITPNLDISTTYFVESHGIFADEIQDGGKPNSDGGGDFSMSSNFYNLFNVWKPFKLVSVRVYAANSSSATIRLATFDNVLLQEKTIVLEQGEQVVNLNFDVPVGTDLTLRNLGGNLFRNNGGLNYPYPIGDMGEITTTNFNSNFYYYFYDWNVQEDSVECVSDRVPVIIDVTGAHEIFTQAGFSIFPNPASDELLVKMANPADHIILFDAKGTVVSEKETAGNTTDVLKISDMAPGLYFIQIMAGGELFHNRFVKE